MNVPEGIAGAGVIALALGGVLLAILLWLFGRALAVLPLSRRRRELVSRWAPLAGMLVVLAYLVIAVRRIFGGEGWGEPAAAVLVFAAITGAAWFAIRDIVAGVVLKAGRICQVGDYVLLGDVAGRVASMGLRVLSIETGQGEEAVIPYSQVARQSLKRTPVLEGAALHVFRLQVPDGATISDVKRRVRESALSCHWGSIVRDPQVVAVASSRFEVTIYALDPDHAPDVEAAVRSAVEGR